MPDPRRARYAVIMAGGTGTRFWPYSRRTKPKQFLAIDGRWTLLQHTARRLRGLVPAERTLVVAPRAFAELIREQLPMLPPDNVIIEPAARGTAPCLVFAAAAIARRNARAAMGVFPADHAIRDGVAFRRCVRRAFEIAERGDALVTLGVRPRGAETGFGYLELGAVLDRRAPRVFAVRRFIEKPDRARARRFAASGRHRWNAGMFVWTVEAFRAAVQDAAPELAALWTALDRRGGRAAPAYRRARTQSIDVAVMERAAHVAAVDAEFDWSDLGTWAAVAERWGADRDGNTARGQSLLVDCRGTFAYGATRLVAVLGARDLLVVESGDAVLVCPRDRAQDVRRVVDALGRGPYRRLR
jgi:mannose-1-phosphate guanylyltransferase